MSKPQKIKQGYMRKYGKAILVDPWKKVFVELDSSGTLYWYKKKKSSSSGHVNIAKVCEFFTIGSYCRAIPFSPSLPSEGSLENMFAFPEEPNKKSKIHFFLCDSNYDFNEWISAIVSFFPRMPCANPQQSSMPISHSPYSPIPAVQYPGPLPQGPALGFEGLSISGNSAPRSAPLGYHPVQQPYPAAQHSPYPAAQQPYPAAQQPYPAAQSSPYPCVPAVPYPQQQQHQQHYYPQQQPQSYPGGYPPYQGYPQQPTYPYAQPAYASGGAAASYVQPQTIVIKEKTKSSPGYGKMAAGVLGGAVAGYAASRMFGGYGGWGFGRGWGRGSWGSCSWSSGSWGSFSGCSWGSFG